MHPENSSQNPNDGAEEFPVPEIEFDQTVPPRPEEEMADAMRAVPDTAVESAD